MLLEGSSSASIITFKPFQVRQLVPISAELSGSRKPVSSLLVPVPQATLSQHTSLKRLHSSFTWTSTQCEYKVMFICIFKGRISGMLYKIPCTFAQWSLESERHVHWTFLMANRPCIRAPRRCKGLGVPALALPSKNNLWREEFKLTVWIPHGREGTRQPVALHRVRKQIVTNVDAQLTFSFPSGPGSSPRRMVTPSCMGAFSTPINSV